MIARAGSAPLLDASGPARLPKMDDAELQGRLIYSAIVAGKSAKFTDGVMWKFHAHRQEHLPLDFIRILIDEGNLEFVLRDMRCGNYTKLERCFRELAESSIDIRTCGPEELETIHGIGPKTSRFFILWTRPGERFAALDVHVLRWMREKGYDAPKSTPSGEKYRELEKAFMAEADARGITPRELDAEIWKTGAKYTEDQ